MRRALVSALAVPALILAGCSGDDTGPDASDVPTAAEEPVVTAPPADSGQPTSAPAEADAATATADPAASTALPEGEVEGGEEGQAAADVAKAFYVAMIDADAKVCDHLLSFSDAEKPMKDHESDYETCQELLPEVLGEDLPEDSAELAAIVEAMQIRGADVDGDTAVIDSDNYSELFARTIGQDPITLRKIDGEWYIDLDRSFQPTE